MATIKRRNSPLARRPTETPANIPETNQREPVHIRRNIEDFDDPYLPEESYAGTAICQECHAVFHSDRWILEERFYQEALHAEDRRFILCPACRKLHHRQPGGIVTLTSDFIPEHREEILNLIRNEDARARSVNPLERVMQIQEEGNRIVVATTNEKLAQRLGRAMRRAYKGHVEYQWLDDSKQARVFWTR